MKVLYLTKYDRKGASSRLRSYQFFPLLEKEGIAITVQPFFNEKYLHLLYSKRPISKVLIFSFYVKRFLTLFTIHKYNKIVIEKELFPYFFSWFEKLFYCLKIKYIVDYDDAIFHNYDLSSSAIVRLFFKNKISNVMKFSGCVMAGNEYLALKAKNAGAKKIVLQPTVIDVSKYAVIQNPSDSQVIIGWIGSPTTFKYVKNLKSVFETLILKYKIEIQVIGANEDIGLGDAIKYIRWTESGEVALISDFDIGIMPLENTPWEQGKCAYKLIQYMGSGIPVVASAVGMNLEVVDDEENGFLVKTDAEWIEKLSILIENKSMRNQFGMNGRLKIEKKYSLENNFNKLLPIINL